MSCGTDIIRDQEWNINTSDIEKSLGDADDVPALSNPRYKTLTEMEDFMEDDDLVIVANVDGSIKIFPTKILVYHEAVNETNELIFYSTLTGTSSMWRRVVDGERLDFGISAYSHNNNSLLYDKTTGSYWSQVLSKSVSGQYIGTEISHFNVLETTWATAKLAYANAPVLSTDTGFARAYDVYPYGSYRDNDDLILPFNMDYLDTRLPPKHRVLGILGDSTSLAYAYSNLPSTGMFLYEDVIDNQEIIVIGSQDQNILVAFEKEAGVSYTAVDNELPVIFSDGDGNQYNLFGEVLLGPDLGTTLSAPRTMAGYWFMFPAYYDDIEIR